MECGSRAPAVEVWALAALQSGSWAAALHMRASGCSEKRRQAAAFHKPKNYIGEISTVARVFSHSRRRVQPLALLSKAIVKFSTSAEVAPAVISTRSRSESAPGYGMPHSPVFLLTIKTHLSLSGTVNRV